MSAIQPPSDPMPAVASRDVPASRGPASTPRSAGARRAGGASSYLWALLLTAAAVYLPWVALSAHQQAPVGDLVRIGGWSERSYGWQAAQPEVAVRHNRADRDGAQVWVLGDSFSMGNVWQSVWSQEAAIRIHTQGYQGHGCLEAFIQAALAEPAVQQVVIQTIERHLLDRWNQASLCPAAGPEAFEGPPGRTAASRPSWQGRALAFDGQGFLGFWPLVDWRILLRAQWNEARTAHPAAAKLRLASGDTLNAPLERAAPFSNPRNDRLLYYLGDDFKRAWSPEQLERAAAQAAALQARVEAAGKRFTLLVVPDKSSVYRPWLRPADRIPSPPIEAVFRAAGVSIDHPLAAMTDAAAATVDFYLPDDTHLSPAGFAWLGRHMARTASRKAKAL